MPEGKTTPKAFNHTNPLQTYGDEPVMLIQRYSRTRKVFGTVSALSLIIGVIGLAMLMVSGVGTSALYWNAIYTFMALTATGVLGIRLYGMIWRR